MVTSPPPNPPESSSGLFQTSSDHCIFCSIVQGNSPSFKIFEDDLIISFLDISPFSDGEIIFLSLFYLSKREISIRKSSFVLLVYYLGNTIITYSSFLFFPFLLYFDICNCRTHFIDY